MHLATILTAISTVMASGLHRIAIAPQNCELCRGSLKMSSRNCLLTHFLPTLVRCRESHVQYNLNRSPLPANNGLRLGTDHRPLPSWPQPPQDHPNQFIRSGKLRLRVLLFQIADLLLKRQVFQQQVAAKANETGNPNRQKPQQAQHEPSLQGNRPYWINHSSA